MTIPASMEAPRPASPDFVRASKTYQNTAVGYDGEMLSSLSAAVRIRASELRKEFERARPFPHVVIDSFLEPALCAGLLAEFPAFDVRAARNETGATGRKAVVSQLPALGPAYRAFDALMRSREFLDWTGRVTGIPDLVYDPDYIGGGTHENLDGQDLDLHVDFNYHPSRPLHRRLNLIVFLNSRWEESWGGCLELREDPWADEETASSKVVPILNRAVIFATTETSWHGFPQIRSPEGAGTLSRRSIAVYFYTKARPPEQTAPSHATVYIPRALPSRFEAGYTLSPADANELQILIARRDAQIRFLYEREKETFQVMSATMNSPSFRIGRALTWPLRKALGKP